MGRKVHGTHGGGNRRDGSSDPNRKVPQMGSREVELQGREWLKEATESGEDQTVKTAKNGEGGSGGCGNPPRGKTTRNGVIRSVRFYREMDSPDQARRRSEKPHGRQGGTTERSSWTVSTPRTRTRTGSSRVSTRPRAAPQRTGNCPGGRPPKDAKVQVERPKDEGGARKPNEWLRRVDER